MSDDGFTPMTNRKPKIALAIISALVAGTCLSPVAANAKVVTTGSYAQWRSEAGTDNTGSFRCDASTYGPDGSFRLAATTERGGHIFLRVWDAALHFNQQQNVTVTLTVDNVQPIQFEGVGRTVNNDGGMVDVQLPLDYVLASTNKPIVQELTNLFRGGLKMTLQYAGREWVVGLRGASAALQATGNCIEAMPSADPPARHADTPTTVVPPQESQPTTVVPAPEEETAPKPLAQPVEVPLTKMSNGYAIDGNIGGTTVTFIIDTGADLIAIPQKVADRLIQSDQLTITGNDTFTDANGRTNMNQTGTVKEMMVAREVGHNISVIITDNQYGLLGQNFFQHFSSYKIDNSRGVLELE